jgi:putative PEP-CTERM system histidine kinase
MNVTVVTHVICAAAFGGLVATMFAGRLRGRTGNMLIAACLATVLWALAGAADGAIPFTVVALAESVRNAVWLMFLCSLLVTADGAPSAGWVRTETVVATVVALGAIAVDLASLVFAPASVDLAQPQVLMRIAAAVLALSLVENYYRNTETDRRWNVVPLSIAVGGMFAFDLFYYVDVFLSQTDQPLAAARALADALSVPLLGLAMVRNDNWRTDIRLSHNAAFHTLTLVSSGIFLVSAAIVGVLFRRYGGQWGIVLQVTSLFGSAVVLATVLSSETARSGIRMALLRNFFSYRYDYRVEWLRCIEVMSSADAAVELPERVVRAIADSVNSPGGVLFQRHDDVFVPSAFWNARVPADAREAEDGSFLAGFRGGRWIQSLREDGAGPESAPPPAWLGDAHDFWIAVPLPHVQEIVGFVLLLKPRAAVKPDWEVYDLLRIVARQAASYLSERQAQRALADTQLLQEYSKRFAFVVHDIKNLSSQLGLILSNARRHAGNPEFQADVMRTVENSVARMNNLLSQLRMASASPPRTEAPTDAVSVVRELVAAHAHGARIDTDCARINAVVQMDSEPLRSILAHLIDNAVEASGAQGRVRVRLAGDDDRVTIDVSDEGPGMEVSFVRDELFRPFRSTKDTGFGIGAFQTRELVRAAGGQLEVATHPGAGTTMRVVLKRGDGVPQISPAA